MTSSMARRRAQALRAALASPACLGRAQLAAWAGSPPALPKAATAQPAARVVAWAAARAAAPSQCALAAANDHAAGRGGQRPRWASDEAPAMFGVPQPWRSPAGWQW